MKRAILVQVLVVLCLCLAGCGKPPAGHAKRAVQRTDNPAADLVHNYDLGSNLERMANDVARMTQTAYMAGLVKTTRVIHRLAPKYRAKWDANLARAYAAHLSPEALRSLSVMGKSSPYYAELEKQRHAISLDMQASSSPILDALVREALITAFKETHPVDPSKLAKKRAKTGR